MSLNDVDKNSQDRGTPQPNHNDQLIDGARKNHGTNSANYVSDSTSSSTSGIKYGFSRLVSKGVISCDVPAGSDGTITTSTFTVAHNLGYSPLITAFMNNISGPGYGIPLPMIVSVTSGATAGTVAAVGFLAVTRWATVAADGTNFYVIFYSSGSSVIENVYQITYYLYQQQSQ